MIPTANINDVTDYAPGWIGRYCNVMGRNKFPWSYHLLAGMFALGVVVGRRAAVNRSTYTLWPPTSILLLGPSGVGKTQTLHQARRLIKEATRKPWQNENGDHPFRPGFCYSEQSFTPRGLMEHWTKVQYQQKVEFLEGCHIETEVAKVVTKKKGSEVVNTWIINVLEHEDLSDYTGMWGRKELKNLTLAFGFASTVPYLRGAMNADEFSGGFMHRFLISHEDLGRKTEAERPTTGEIRSLAAELEAIHRAAPAELEVEDGAMKLVKLLEGQKKFFSNHQLSGFWERFGDICLKIAQLFTLSQGEGKVTKQSVERAEALLRNRLSPVLEGLVDELAASEEFKKLLDLSDSLRTAGPKGWTQEQLWKKMGVGSLKRRLELLQSMEEMKLAFRGRTRFYARKEWIDGFSHDGVAEPMDGDLVPSVPEGARLAEDDDTP